MSLAEVIQPTVMSLLSPLTVEGMYTAKFIALITCLKLELWGLFWEEFTTIILEVCNISLI